MDMHDLVGIGFGPSHIGLAVSLYEDYKEETEGKKITFFEAKNKHGWHHPMMLPSAKMQISFMKDLCFLRNPKSHFTFVNYLHEHRRLSSFANLRDFNPSRKEFDDYLRWVAGHFNHVTRYSSWVQSILPVKEDNQVVALDVTVNDMLTGNIQVVRTQNLAIAIGGEPAMPVACASPHVFHSSQLLEKLSEYDENERYRFLVVGSGQSAAEIYQYLITRYRNADVRVASSGIGFKQADDSEYVNEVFDNEMIDRFYHLDPDNRQALIRKHFDTNYSVADLAIIQSLYREEYEALISGDVDRFGMLKFKRLTNVVEYNKALSVTLVSTLDGERQELEVDVVICATGYSRKNNLALLDSLKPYWAESAHIPRLSRNYALQMTANFKPNIYIQGMSEHTHGLSDTLLSVISRRSHEVGGEIVNTLNNRVMLGAITS
jgi:L-ornithine N5-oxygenase